MNTECVCVLGFLGWVKIDYSITNEVKKRRELPIGTTTSITINYPSASHILIKKLYSQIMPNAKVLIFTKYK